MAIPWLAIASTGLSAFSSIQSGRVRAGQALQSAKLAANENMFANLGRADDPSMQAFFDNQKDIVSEDIRVATNQSLISMRKTEIEAASLRAGSKNALRSATVNAFGDIMGGISSYRDSRKKSDKD